MYITINLYHSKLFKSPQAYKCIFNNFSLTCANTISWPKENQEMVQNLKYGRNLNVTATDVSQTEYLIHIIIQFMFTMTYFTLGNLATYLFYLVCCCHCVEKFCKCFPKCDCSCYRNGQSSIEIRFTSLFIYLDGMNVQCCLSCGNTSLCFSVCRHNKNVNSKYSNTIFESFSNDLYFLSAKILFFSTLRNTSLT